MEQNHSEILDAEFNEDKDLKRRRKLLPWWIKVFIWIFLILAVITPFGVIAGLSGMSFQFSLYGLETFEPLSLTGLILIAIFLYKGLVAFGLWTEKAWAVSLGEIDAVIGIIICVFIMIVNPFIDNMPGFNLNLRLELIVLIPYLIKLKNIKYEWENRTTDGNE